MIGVIVSHPDDEVLGCGGLLASWGLTQAEMAKVLYLGRGRSEQQASGAYRAAEVLGFGPFFADIGLEDQRFDAHPLLDLVQEVERFLSDASIYAVYTHHRGDLNLDHRLTFQAVLTATRPGTSIGYAVRELYSFEVPSSTEWAFDGSFRPNVFEDVGPQCWERKLRALECYFDEMRPYPHPRSPKAVEARARYWGSVAGLEMAEAFELVRSVNAR